MTWLARRPDIAAMVVVLVFAAFANAAGMVGPVLDWEFEVQQQLGLTSSLPLILLLSVTALLLLPTAAMGVTAWASRALGGLNLSNFSVAVRFSASLVPLGFAMWLAHYGFHFVTGYDSENRTDRRAHV